MPITSESSEAAHEGASASFEFSTTFRTNVLATTTSIPYLTHKTHSSADIQSELVPVYERILLMLPPTRNHSQDSFVEFPERQAEINYRHWNTQGVWCLHVFHLLLLLLLLVLSCHEPPPCLHLASDARGSNEPNQTNPILPYLPEHAVATSVVRSRQCLPVITGASLPAFGLLDGRPPPP